MNRSRMLAATAVLAATAALAAPPAIADPPSPQLSGAIFTTDASGVPVNLNIYDAKEDVYLNGGPGINAPDSAAGLPEGDYYFQVTDPSGKVLLSTDPVTCRGVHVDASGVFTNVLPAGGCEHATGVDGEDGGATVQLFPYLDTPNNGGVYKVWLTPTDDLDCGAPGSRHCFVPHHSKTDNYKVRNDLIVEIDTRFWKPGHADPIDGQKVTWTDTVGASNVKYSEYNPAVLAFHEAHVEAAEQGMHVISIANQPDCTIDRVTSATGATVRPRGGQADVKVSVKSHTQGSHTYWVDVYCTS